MTHHSSDAVGVHMLAVRCVLLMLTDHSPSHPTHHFAAAHLCKQMRVVSDEACVPELRPELFRNITGDMSSSINGWIKQQLIKLACSLTVQVPIFACCCMRCCC